MTTYKKSPEVTVWKRKQSCQFTCKHYCLPGLTENLIRIAELVGAHLSLLQIFILYANMKNIVVMYYTMLCYTLTCTYGQHRAYAACRESSTTTRFLVGVHISKRERVPFQRM